MTEPISPAIAGVSLITLAVALVGPQAGPYVVIVLGSIGGGLWALSSTALESRIAGAWLMLRCVVTAIILTAAVAGLAGHWLGIEASEVYVITAFLLSAMGNHWHDVLASIKARLQSLISSGGKS